MGPSVPAIIDRRSLMKGAAAVGVASAVTVGAADRAGASTVTLDPTPGQGVANRVALQAAIDATPAGEVLVIPDGTYEIDITATGLTIGKSITIAGAGDVVLDVLPKSTGTMKSLFVIPSTVTKGDFAFESFTIAGPTSTSGGGAAIEWIRNGARGSITLFVMTVTGQFAQAVRRSGIGQVTLLASSLNARSSVVHVTDGSGGAGPSSCVVANCTITGHGAQTASFGLDLQPHIALQCAGTRFEHLSHLAVNVQTGPTTPLQAWTMTDCEIVDAGLASTGPAAHAVFTRVTQTVAPTWPAVEVALRGPVTFVDCDLRQGGPFTLTSGSGPTRRFVGCWFEPRGTMVIASTASGTLAFDGCTWKLTNPSSRAINLTASWTGTARLRRSAIADCGTNTTNLIANGGTVVWKDTSVDSPKANHGLSIGTGATVVGSPTLVNTGTCPSSPA